ncbi:hypothetical protein ACFV0T_25705 [Streptomyces sp. NPDC059582]|uniref:hypothetical protein n=1 Tax=Streptomyces sp. NPDC059582 TaxID=3346875 RepID=UPI0036968641
MSRGRLGPRGGPVSDGEGQPYGCRPRPFAHPLKLAQEFGEAFGVVGREAARVVEVHGARGGGVDEPFEQCRDLVGALGVPGEGGQS